MKGVMFVAVAIAGLGLTAALAQQDPIAARKAAMKSAGDQARVGAAMTKGETPFDLAKAKQIFATYADVASKAAPQFPENSKTGGDTAAAPKIWETKADFEAKMVKFGQDAKAAEAAVKDEASFKEQYPQVMKNCGGCHETYRLKKS